MSGRYYDDIRSQDTRTSKWEKLDTKLERKCRNCKWGDVYKEREDCQACRLSKCFGGLEYSRFESKWTMKVDELFIWQSVWFLKPSARHVSQIKKELEQMHFRSWCMRKKWDINEPNLLQLPGDGFYKVNGVIPYENLNIMLHKAMHRLFVQWKTGYPFPSTFVDGKRRIPMYEFLIRGDATLGTQKSYFCKFLALSIAEGENAERDCYSKLTAMLDVKRLRELNPHLTRLDADYVDELKRKFMEIHNLPKNHYDFEPLIRFMRGYGITL
jgi:hypothetical protein